MNDFVNLIEHSDLSHSVWPGNPDPLLVLFIIVLAFLVGMFHRICLYVDSRRALVFAHVC